MDEKQIRQYQLSKQLFFHKQKGEDYYQVFRDQIALHSTDYLTPYISLWARVENFEPKLLFNDLSINKRAARLRGFRGTLFVISRDCITNVLSASEIFLSQRIYETNRYAQKFGFDFGAASNEVQRLLANGPSLSTREIKKKLSLELKGDSSTVLMRYLEFSNTLARAPQKHLYDRVVKYCLWPDCFPGFELDRNPLDALSKVLMAYIKQFGPVTIDDMCWWFPLAKKVVKGLLVSEGPSLQTIKIGTANHYMTKSDFHPMQNFTVSEEKNVISFLPYEDHFVKAFKNRDWFLQKSALPLVTEKGIMMQGQIFPSIWLDGKIIGRWFLEWIDKKKSAAQVLVGNILQDCKTTLVLSKIDEKRSELESFINDKIVPLIKN